MVPDPGPPDGETTDPESGLCCPANAARLLRPDQRSEGGAFAAQGVCHSFACAILDGLDEQIAVLNEDGTIIAVNQAWRKFASENQPQAAQRLSSGDLGRNYLDVCRQAEAAGDAGAMLAWQGIDAVLQGRSTSFEHEYDCHSPLQQRWFSMRVTPLAYGWRGAVVAHTDVSKRRLAEASLRIAAIAFESPEGMMVTDAQGIILQVNHAFTLITGYGREEVVGKRPSLLSSGRHDAAFYQAMWGAVRSHGSWEGEIWNRRKNGEVYPERLAISTVLDDARRVTHYVASLSDITVSKAANDEILRLAFYDPLTRLPNRRLLLDRLRQALAACALNGHYGALMFIDLDDFKTLNDTLGHNVGDLLLQQVALRLQDCLRQGDTVARLGGDEFVVLIEGMSSHGADAVAQAELLSAKILAALNLPYLLGKHRSSSTPSIGVTLFHNGKPQKPDELLMQADIAMYQAKQAGRNGVRLFDQGMQDSLSARAGLEAELRQAVEQSQFAVFYQVQVDATGQARGAEALLRWCKPDGTMVSPASFIPLAEETGLILPLGRWVLRQACAQLRLWRTEPATRALVLAVNVSARQFRQPDFCQQVESAVQEQGIDPALLKLELTEGILLEDIENTIAVMKTLRLLGVRFSLDDFGTGYSSLQYLKRLPLDQLKIDQSFVRDLASDSNDQAIVATIIAMARSLGLEVIAEGVETEAQRGLLEQLGCLHYQGYLFSRPVPAPQFEAWVLARQLAAA
ncbi:EAL domain-containing protein [Oxalobacteraceae bacterium]|nr:EAL domain-containing protein [Oxalobacteraceae bacterium]